MSTEGLRERKKRQTETAIELAGIELALEMGHEAVTVADICSRAEVSRSTFFNYMPSLEAAVFGRPYPRLAAEDVAARLDAAPNGPLIPVLLDIAFSTIGHSAVNPEVASRRFELMRRRPETQAQVRGPLSRLFDDLAESAAQWLESHPGRAQLAGSPRREARLLVGILGLAMEDLVVTLGTSGSFEDAFLTPDKWAETIETISRIATAEARGLAEKHDDVT